MQNQQLEELFKSHRVLRRSFFTRLDIFFSRKRSPETDLVTSQFWGQWTIVFPVFLCRMVPRKSRIWHQQMKESLSRLMGSRQVQIRRSDTHWMHVYVVDIVPKRQVVCRWKSSLDCVTNVTPECFMWKKWHKSTMWSKLEIQFEFHDVNSWYFYVPLGIMAKLVSLIGTL